VNCQQTQQLNTRVTCAANNARFDFLCSHKRMIKLLKKDKNKKGRNRDLLYAQIAN
jgi:hypothetical protein